ncbi:hypothetical protein ACOSQ4_014876 [Xanthoceras sorbifolium]
MLFLSEVCDLDLVGAISVLLFLNLYIVGRGETNTVLQGGHDCSFGDWNGTCLGSIVASREVVNDLESGLSKGWCSRVLFVPMLKGSLRSFIDWKQNII